MGRFIGGLLGVIAIVAAIVVVLVVIGGLIGLAVGDGTNVRESTLEALNPLPEDASNEAITTALNNELGDDATDVTAAITGVRGKGVTMANIKSKLSSLEDDGRKEVVAAINALDPSAVAATTPTMTPTVTAGQSPTATPTTSVPTPTPGNTGLTASEIRSIIAEELEEVKPGLTAEQVKEIVDDAITSVTTVPGLTEVQVRALFNNWIAQNQPLVTGSGSTGGSGGNINTGSAAACPTDGEMQKAFGFHVMNPPIKPVSSGNGIAWEGCKWQVQWTGQGYLQLPMLEDWQFTATMEDDSVVTWYGDGQVRLVKGATIRYRPHYKTPSNNWVNDGCTLLRKENEYSMSRNPAYETLNGNVCTSAPAYRPATVTTVTGNPPASTCYASASAVAAAVGGDVSGWSQEDPTNFPNVWKYKLKGTNVQLTHPGSPVVTIDYWNGGVATATAAGALPVQVDEATVKC